MDGEYCVYDGQWWIFEVRTLLVGFFQFMILTEFALLDSKYNDLYGQRLIISWLVSGDCAASIG